VCSPCSFHIHHLPLTSSVKWAFRLPGTFCDFSSAVPFTGTFLSPLSLKIANSYSFTMRPLYCETLNKLTFLCFSFIFFKVGIIVIPTSWVLQEWNEIKCVYGLKV
jgi:hypothetical protein